MSFGNDREFIDHLQSKEKGDEMTIDEAIIIKETPEPGYFAIPVRDRRAANNLSIEALKFLQEYRTFINSEVLSLLSGETKE